MPAVSLECETGGMRSVIRVLVSAFALWLTTLIVGGSGDHGVWIVPIVADNYGRIATYVVVALIFGLVNAIIKPIVKLFSLPFYILTLGLFTFIVNAFMLQITSWLADALTLTFHVNRFFWDAILGAIVISLVSTVVSLILPDSWEGKAVDR